MRVLCTGSEGFIGKNLVARLEQDGHEVVGWDLHRDYEFKHVGRREDLLSQPTEEVFDVIFHLACVNQMDALRYPFENVMTNAYGTGRMASYAAATGAKFIYTSTASVYGNASVIPTPVDAKLSPLTDYAVAKLAGEFFVQNSGADWTILRLSNVYGPHQTTENPYCGVIGRFFDQARKGEPLTVIGSGMQTRDFTFVEDVVDYLVSAAHTANAKNIYNVSRGMETNILDLAQMINRLYGEDSIGIIPYRPIDGVDRRSLEPSLPCFTPLDKGLKKTKEWFDEQSN